MGDPKKHRKKYETPSHPWKRERIEKEKELLKKYGLKNKREIWIAESKLRNFRRQARILQALGTEQSKREEIQLLEKLKRFGLLKSDAEIDTVLGLEIEDVLDRRLQSVVYRKGLARTLKHARQLITHGHVRIKGRRIMQPSYFVGIDEENEITTDLVVS